MLLEVALLLVAILYSSTGHGGGTGYIAVLVLAGYAAADAAPVALALNLVVATTALVAFQRKGGAHPRLLLPLAVAGIPLAVVGSLMPLSPDAVAWVLAPALLIAAGLLWFRPEAHPRQVAWPVLVAIGAVLGLLAGMTGIGGGIYLTPILLMAGWARKQEAAWVSAGFIVLNSAAGLAARVAAGSAPDAGTLLGFAAPVLVGGLVGSFLGAGWFNPVAYRRVLSTILGLATLKLVGAF